MLNADSIVAAEVLKARVKYFGCKRPATDDDSLAPKRRLTDSEYFSQRGLFNAKEWLMERK